MQLQEFIQHHMILTSLFAVFLVAVLIFEFRARLKAGIKLSPQAVIAMVNRENALLIDIRPADKFSNGHIINAKHTAQDKAEDLLKQLKISQDKPIVMVCQRGISAALVGERLKKQGYTRIYVLQGGMDAWLQAQLPLEKP
jgi:rhodanese-related sulfurtransferase